MTFKSILIANRGEIAIRVARAAADLGIRTVAVYSEDDAGSLHVKIADEARPLGAAGPAAYLDIERVIAAARAAQCQSIHPGYGFLSENADFARACAAAGIVFIGPSPEVLSVFGDKARARALADSFGVPILQGTSGATSLEQARDFMGQAQRGDHGEGVGGRRRPWHARRSFAGPARRGLCALPVRGEGQFRQRRGLCRSLYAERAPHRGTGGGRRQDREPHLGTRLLAAARHQKIVEIAPAPSLDPDLRQQLCDAAVWLADDVKLSGLATVEFLVNPKPARHAPAFAFIECNPRLQVEHTVTEEITGIDLVAVQIELARGNSLRDIGLKQENIPKPRGVAMQLRINMEKMAVDGSVRPSGGTLTRFVPPSGPGVRVDTFGYEGYVTNPAFDPLLAKLIVQAPDFTLALGRAKRALREFAIAGVDTNIAFLDALLDNPEVAGRRTNTRLVEDNMASLVAAAADWKPNETAAAPAVSSAPIARPTSPAGTVAVRAPMQGKVVSISVAQGDIVRAGIAVAVLEAMKMEHLVVAGCSGRVHSVAVTPGDVLFEGGALIYISPEDVEAAAATVEALADPDMIRPDLAESIRASRVRPRREPPRRDGAAAQDQPAHRARERRRSRRSGKLHRIWRARLRRAEEAPHARRSDQEHPGRRHHHRHRHDQRVRFRRRTRARRGAGLRLHRARRHAGRDEPPQEGPAAEGRGRFEAARRAVHGRRRPAGPATRTSPASRASTRPRSANTRN